MLNQIPDKVEATKPEVGPLSLAVHFAARRPSVFLTNAQQLIRSRTWIEAKPAIFSRPDGFKVSGVHLILLPQKKDPMNE